MRPLIIALILTAATSCTPAPAAPAPLPSTTAVSGGVGPALATPLPSGVVDAAPLIARDTRIGRIVLRVDDVTATLTTMRDFGGGTSALLPFDASVIWAIAIVGRIHIDALIDLPDAQCAVFAHDAATGDVRASKMGPLSMCQPYFPQPLRSGR